MSFIDVFKVLEYSDISKKSVMTVFYLAIGFMTAIPTMSAFYFFKETSANTEKLLIQNKKLIAQLSTIYDAQKVMVGWTVDLSKTMEYTSNEQSSIIKELAKNESIRDLIAVKEEKIKQYQVDHLPHHQPEAKTIQQTFSIKINRIK